MSTLFTYEKINMMDIFWAIPDSEESGPGYPGVPSSCYARWQPHGSLPIPIASCKLSHCKLQKPGAVL